MSSSPPSPASSPRDVTGAVAPRDAGSALGAAVLGETLDGLRELKRLADAAIAQVDDRALAATLDAESNSIAVLVRHVAGNMRSRWTDLLESDGEKPGRDRDGEFTAGDGDADRARLLAEWDAAWALCLGAIGALRPEELTRTVHIRGQPLTVLEALGRATRHYAQHVGQIVLLAKHHAGDGWRTLSIPRRR
jgi:hypothetical protein